MNPTTPTVPFHIVVALDKNFGIGKEGDLPWHLPADLKHFKELTSRTADPQKKNMVLMGRKTWESLPARFRPLPGRINAVVSRNPGLPLPEGVYRLPAPEELLRLLDTELAGRLQAVYIIGGAEIFRAASDAFAGRIVSVHVTHIDGDFGCDTVFPTEIVDWDHPLERSESREEDGVSFLFAEYPPAAGRKKASL